jgi:AcrR family transcriptional regulator
MSNSEKKAGGAAAAKPKPGAPNKTAAKKGAVKKAAPKKAQAGPARRGRPPRLTQQAVIAKALELLEKRVPEEITLALLAKELDTATVTLYKYFPNRDAVLSAAAEYFYSLFEFPAPRRNEPWQERALDWLWAVYRHIQKHPLAWRMYGVDGQLSTAMMKMCAPANRLLEQEGLHGEALAFASAWFINHALGLIFNEVTAGDFRQPVALRHIVDLAPADQETYLALRPHLGNVKSAEVLDFGFAMMVDGLGRLFARQRGGRRSR